MGLEPRLAPSLRLRRNRQYERAEDRRKHHPPHQSDPLVNAASSKRFAPWLNPSSRVYGKERLCTTKNGCNKSN
jgi:hypothetical protein